MRPLMPTYVACGLPWLVDCIVATGTVFPPSNCIYHSFIKILEYHGLFKEKRCTAEELSKCNIQAMLVICKKTAAFRRKTASSFQKCLSSKHATACYCSETRQRALQVLPLIFLHVDNQMWKCGKTKAVIPFLPLGLPSLSLHAVLSWRRFCTALVALYTYL